MTMIMMIMIIIIMSYSEIKTLVTEWAGLAETL